MYTKNKANTSLNNIIDDETGLSLQDMIQCMVEKELIKRWFVQWKTHNEIKRKFWIN